MIQVRESLDSLSGDDVFYGVEHRVCRGALPADPLSDLTQLGARVWWSDQRQQASGRSAWPIRSYSSPRVESCLWHLLSNGLESACFAAV